MYWIQEIPPKLIETFLPENIRFKEYKRICDNTKYTWLIRCWESAYQSKKPARSSGSVWHSQFTPWLWYPSIYAKVMTGFSWLEYFICAYNNLPLDRYQINKCELEKTSLAHTINRYQLKTRQLLLQSGQVVTAFCNHIV